MKTSRAWIVALALVAGASSPLWCVAQEQPAEKLKAEAKPDLDPALKTIRREAAALMDVVESDLAKQFLATADQLGPIEPRMIYRNAKTRGAIDEAKYNALTESEKAEWKGRAYDTRFYYTTGYGSPTIYARPLDILVKHGVTTLRGKKVMDFGYGMIGQERMMALLGADVHGVEVEELFKVLYSWPDDQGEIASKDGTRGRVTLHHGQWPADPALAKAVGGGYDVIMSKNTLKKGYIHPAREADPSRLVKLGVSDEEFLKASFGALKPGGVMLVYNISPKQAPADKPYIPWADGEFPFRREMAEKAGFEVLAFDATDDEKIREVFSAIDASGKTPESFKDDLFSHYTVLRRPAKN